MNDKLVEQIGEVIDKTIEETGILLAPCELAEVLQLTERKCDMNRKEMDYFPLLLEDTLRERIYQKVLTAMNEEEGFGWKEI